MHRLLLKNNCHLLIYISERIKPTEKRTTPVKRVVTLDVHRLTASFDVRGDLSSLERLPPSVIGLQLHKKGR